VVLLTGVLALFSCIFCYDYSSFLTEFHKYEQGPILKEYPSKIMFSAICTFFGAIQSFFVALVTERDFNKWKLHLDDSLLAVLYTVIFKRIRLLVCKFLIFWWKLMGAEPQISKSIRTLLFTLIR
jgi:hypothetical protein